jgi:hypothetical protein
MLSERIVDFGTLYWPLQVIQRCLIAEKWKQSVRFQVLTAANMKMAVFWDIARWVHRPDDRDSKHIWNVGKPLPYYTAQQPRGQPFLNLSLFSRYVKLKLFLCLKHHVIRFPLKYHSLKTWTLDGAGWLASRCGRFTLTIGEGDSMVPTG